MENYRNTEQRNPGVLCRLGNLLVGRGGQQVESGGVPSQETPADYDPKYDLTSGQFDVYAWQARERREAPWARWEFDAPSPIPPEINEGTLTSEDFMDGLATVRQRHR